MHAIEIPRLRTTARFALQRVEGGFDVAFGAKANPWRHLGGTAFFLFFVVAGTALERAEALLSSNGAGALAVINDAGEVVGLLLKGRLKRRAQA